MWQASKYLERPRKRFSLKNQRAGQPMTAWPFSSTGHPPTLARLKVREILMDPSMKKGPMVISIELKKQRQKVWVSTYRFTTTTCIPGPLLFHQDRGKRRWSSTLKLVWLLWHFPLLPWRLLKRVGDVEDREGGVIWRLVGHWGLLCIINYKQQGYRCRIHNK